MNVQRIKEFFNKYWGYIVAFALGIVAYLGFDSARGKRIDRDISRLKSELREYAIRIEQLESINRRLREQAKQLGENNERFNDSIQELDEISRASREVINRTESHIEGLQVSIAELGDDTSGLRNIENKLQQQSESIRTNINRLGEFIEKYSQETNDN